MLNALTVDVEDYFQVNAFKHHVTRESWESYPLRVNDNTRRLLDIFDEYQARATFFILGWVAERLPSLVREIVARGHEIGSHGYGHELLFEIGIEKARQDIRRGRLVLEDVAGVPIRGYRAPSYSITERSLWGFDILAEEGFSFDSSIFPIVHDVYGMPNAPRFPFSVHRQGRVLQEFPLSTLPIRFPNGIYRLPIAGGGYLRLLPVSLIGHGIKRINGVENEPAVLYLHPWEIDPRQPRIHAPWRSRFRHYHNLNKMEAKLRYLLGRFEFGPMDLVLKAHWSATSRVPTIAVGSPFLGIDPSSGGALTR
ncbi:XrtA system polysaccharide deacetylase [Geomesophilobacter sediminis]|uniref:DUF3473 domain-containing protein n=1 Tax=Geomesophilobacter sediminis TaxID=2798584 RepID=A0A8J7JK76_9BACT|nr:XrtA system polysaccharide deacetylase [Geomesophilobacter sediminis]MBJ6723650.1 DUF3473 domain-containing protein [Geomesophilobacter sediminis]